MALPWTGPWRVVEHMTDVDYKIESVSKPGCLRVIHMDNLKKFETPFGELEVKPSLPEQNEVRTDDHPDDLDPMKDEVDTKELPEVNLPGTDKDQKVIERKIRDELRKLVPENQSSEGNNESGSDTSRRLRRVVKPIVRFQAK
jgi:hypothetical protein